MYNFTFIEFVPSLHSLASCNQLSLFSTLSDI
jgi:hypothetical protein